ncbi:CsxC family protein [Bacillus sp. NEB1478]|uniref:CsxC family protein n=1 Tax=Bacillus sp. NEB1478 TaxID=3073816 RepID=UPI0028734C96|nr:hypothetical protein [Bacillus sp. NEB1478]WNB90582.1 hypothetical protein RGB74_11715 [Bacillus sp. NEB1478]
MSVSPFPRSVSTNFCKANIVDPFIVSAHGTIIKTPVVLQAFSVQLPMHAKIAFPKGEEVLEIKQIKKRVFITQCRLVQPKGSTATGNLFLSGFVRKNIQYAANPVVDCKKEVLSTINSLTVELPFDCVVQIESFRTPPVGPFFDSQDEFGFFTSTPLGAGFPEKDRLEGTDLSQFHQLSTQFFNELPFCEIIRADITEFDESLDRIRFTEPVPCEIECRVIKCRSCHERKCKWCKDSGRINQRSSLFDHSHSSMSYKKCNRCNEGKPKRCEKCAKCTCKKCNRKPLMREGTFTELSEKMILDLTLKLLQNQQVLLD